MKVKSIFSKRVIWILLLLWVANNLWMWFGPYGSMTLREITGESRIPDVLFFGYSVSVLREILTNFGTEGRMIYLGFQLKDYVYPLVYSTLLAGLLIRINLPLKLRFLIFFPWIAAIADYGENILIRKIVLSFPEINNSAATLASVLTIIKWQLIFISVIVIIVFWIKGKISNP